MAAKTLLLKRVFFFLASVQMSSAIMVSPDKPKAGVDSKVVKRSGYDFEGNSIQTYNGDRTRLTREGGGRGQKRVDGDEKGGKLKGEPSEERANFFGNQQGPSSYGYQQYQGYNNAPIQPYVSASGPGPSYGSPFNGGNSIGNGQSPYGGIPYGGSSFGGGGHGNHIESSGGAEYHYEHHHAKKHGAHHKSLAIKALLVPLVGVALLGVATAFVSNPILLQLGVITGKRRRRAAVDADADIVRLQAAQLERKLNEMAALERYMTELPKEEAATQEKMLFANYLTCSGIASSNQTGVANCLERLTCELHHPDSTATNLERHVMGIVTSEILTNEFIPQDVKHRVKVATSRGADSGNCTDFPCYELETQ